MEDKTKVMAKAMQDQMRRENLKFYFLCFMFCPPFLGSIILAWLFGMAF